MSLFNTPIQKSKRLRNGRKKTVFRESVFNTGQAEYRAVQLLVGIPLKWKCVDVSTEDEAQPKFRVFTQKEIKGFWNKTGSTVNIPRRSQLRRAFCFGLRRTVQFGAV